MKPVFTTEWLNEYKAKQKRRKSTPGDVTKTKLVDWATQSNKSRSPHAVALELLERHPEREEGRKEHYAQVRIFRHFELHNSELYDRLHATPNGGHRTKAAAGQMKAEGQKLGYPDTTLNAPRGIYHGMHLELKVGKNQVTAEQRAWLNRLSGDGYYCVLTWEEEDAIQVYERYWNLKPGEQMPAHKYDEKWKEK